ncbi:MAG: ATP-binding protein [Novosphingobium sp.]|nr:ATP-binding protein [Novosphingobium sp.]
MSLPKPRSLMGQMLLAVAGALLLVQGLGAFLIYQAQSARFEQAALQGAAFRLAMRARGERPAIPRREAGNRRGHWRGFRTQHSDTSPLRTGEIREARAEAELGRILLDQDISASEIVVTHRNLADDPFALSRAKRRQAIFGSHDRPARGRLLVAGLRLNGGGQWLITRVRAPPDQREVILPLLLQTLVIYVVLVGAVALILRRITRPLAELTGRVEQFGANHDPRDQVEPVGPDDVRRLIVAHNAMESRISALLDEKDVMLGAIGHDLKTPLSALRVRIESVSDDVEREKMAATIEDIARSLDDILSLARVGRPSDHMERTELSALVASVVEEFEDMGEAVVLGESSRIVLDLRATWLRRALRNLIGNALRYGEQATISLTREGASAIVLIDDDGPGIPEDHIDAMMEPFARGEPSRNSETGGAGLGLALARAIAEQHGGTLNLANRTDAEGHVTGLMASLAIPIT